MAKYIDNVNLYLSKMKIKQTFISLKTGMDKNKLSRILNGKQDVNSSDMEKIAHALGKSVEFFLSEEFSVVEPDLDTMTEIVFYAGKPSKKQELITKQLLEFIENADEVLSAKGLYLTELESE